jgi:RNA recognition motif-containing protein
VQHHVAKRQNDLAHDKTKTAINQNINKNFASNLFVKFIPADVDEAQLHKLFSTYGNIISIKLRVKGESRFNHAYVLYEQVESCQQAIRNLDKTRPFGNQPIDVEFWVSKVDLVAEREAKQKEQMQKFFSSAIYEIKNEMMGGRKPYRNNKRQNPQRTGTAGGGRGGKPMHSNERKSNSKDTRQKSQSRDRAQTQSSPALPTAQPAQFVQVPLPPAAAVAQLQQI